MINVSEKWKNAISAQFRRQGYLQVFLEIVPPGISSIEHLTCDQSSSLISAQELLNSLPTPDEGIATFEKDYWYADGSRYLLDDQEFNNNTTIIWSSRYPSSIEDVVFNLVFDEPVSLPGLTFRWDVINNLWPSVVFIDTYLGITHKYGHQHEVTSINSSVVAEFDNIDRIRITIPKGAWPKADWRVRVSSITPGILIQIDPQIHMSAREHESVSRTGDRLPTSTSQISIRNIVASIGGSTLMKPVAIVDDNKLQPIDGALRDKIPDRIRIASMEERYWGASGQWILLSENTAMNPDLGWASVRLYDPVSQRRIAASTFNELNPISLRFKLEGVSNIDVINIIWDNATGSYPTVWEYYCTDVYGAIVDSKVISNTSQEDIQQQIKVSAEYCSEIEIKIYKWSQVGWRARIDHLTIQSSWDYGNTYTEVNDFFDPMLKRGFSKYLARRQKAYWQWGFVVDNLNTVEWLPQQMRYLDGWEIPADAITATFKFTSRLALMTSIYRKGQVPNTTDPRGITLYEMAARVIMNSTIIKESFSEHPYKLSSTLLKLYTTAPEPVVQENVVLQYIAGAAGCILKTDPLNQVIVITDNAVPTKYTITRKQQLQNPSIELITELKYLNVNIYSYGVDNPKENGEIQYTEAFNGVVKIKGRQIITINYNNNILIVQPTYTITGATVHAVDFYISCAVIDLGTETSEEEIEVQIFIQGRRYNKSFTTYQMYRNDDITNGQTVTINNPLITNIDTANYVAEQLLPWFINRHTLKFDYLGYPELKAGDEAAIYSKYSNSIGFISETDLTFNGGWGGTLTTELDIGKEES